MQVSAQLHALQEVKEAGGWPQSPIANNLINHNETSIKSLEQHGYWASGLVSVSICWEGDAPRKGIETLHHPTLFYAPLSFGCSWVVTFIVNPYLLSIMFSWVLWVIVVHTEPEGRGSCGNLWICTQVREKSRKTGQGTWDWHEARAVLWDWAINL